MSNNYIAHFAFELRGAENLPETERHGFGTIPIVTDKEPKTQEEFLEITKMIFRQGGDRYEKVGLLGVTPVEEDHIAFHDDSDTVLEGEIVID